MREIQKVDNSSKGAGIGNGLVVVVVVFFVKCVFMCKSLFFARQGTTRALFSIPGL